MTAPIASIPVIATLTLAIAHASVFIPVPPLALALALSLAAVGLWIARVKVLPTAPVVVHVASISGAMEVASVRGALGRGNLATAAPQTSMHLDLLSDLAPRNLT